MRESVAVRVRNGDELKESEVNGTVRESESGELDGVNGDLRVFGFEQEEVDGGDGGGDTEEKHGRDETGG